MLIITSKMSLRTNTNQMIVAKSLLIKMCYFDLSAFHSEQLKPKLTISQYCVCLVH
jgi:hypothetical protein